MIYCVLKGGLGNQLFQFAAGLRLARLDTSRITLVLPQGFVNRLEHLFRPEILPTTVPFAFLKERFAGQEFDQLSDTAAGPFVDQPMLDAKLPPGQRVLVEGYFQSSRTIGALRQYIAACGGLVAAVRDFAPSEAQRPVIHFRIGDYKKIGVQNEMGVIDPAYIDRCFEAIPGDVDLYTDEEVIHRIYAHYGRARVVVGGDDIEVFRNFLRAEIVAVPNSTFSLTAAHLSERIRLLIRPRWWTRNSVYDDLTADAPCEVSYLSNRFIWV
ncbi:MAG: hypothetical protein ACM30I_11065 [Gemmatimonas sp.]